MEVEVEVVLNQGRKTYAGSGSDLHGLVLLERELDQHMDLSRSLREEPCPSPD